MAKRDFGSIRKLPSGRFQARYTGPDGVTYPARTEHGRPLTFDTEGYARKYLERVSADIQRGLWKPPATVLGPAENGLAPTQLTLREYATDWLTTRKTTDGSDLSPSTKKLYRQTLQGHVLPPLGGLALDGITPSVVRAWYAKLDTGPRQKAGAYTLLSTILGTAVADELILVNPCRIRGASQSPRRREIRPATLEELAAIAAATPARFRLMPLLAAWCALRFGELTELRRGDIDLSRGVVQVRRGVVKSDAGRVVKDPKSAAGRRSVHIPPHLLPAVEDHMRDHTGPRQDALLFPAASGRHLAPSSMGLWWDPAREKAGRPDLRFHDLRHTGAVLAAATGATLAELMARLGHSTAAMAMRYQHAAADRDRAMAEALSKLATVTPISAATRKRAVG